VTDVDEEAPVLVGVALDGGSCRALGVAFGEAALRGVDVVALHCCRASSPTDATEAVAVRAAIDHLLRPWRRRYGQVTVRIAAVHGETVDQLVRSPEDPQLIVVGRRIRRPLTSRVHGSTGLGVLRAAGVPVVVVRDDIVDVTDSG